MLIVIVIDIFQYIIVHMTDDGLDDGFIIPPMEPLPEPEYEGFNSFTETPSNDAPVDNYRPVDIIAKDFLGTPIRLRVLAIDEGVGDEEDSIPSLPYTIYWADGSRTTLTEEEVLDGYDPTEIADGGEGHTEWGILLSITDGVMDRVAEYNDQGDRFVDNGEDPPIQTAYWLPVFLDSKRVSIGGIYQEDKMCDDDTAVVGLIKVG